MLLVTADTNVIISALYFSGHPHRIWEQAETGFVRLAVSDAILEEVAGVIRRPDSGCPKEEISKVLRHIARFAEHVEHRERLEVVKGDPADNRISCNVRRNQVSYCDLRCAHLLKFGKYAGVSTCNRPIS